MTDQRLVIDIEPKANKSVVEGAQNQTGRAEETLWTRGDDNSFKFNFLPESSPATKEDTSSSEGNAPPFKSTGLTALTGQGSGFAFNFQIPSTSPEDMKTETLPPALLEAAAAAAPGSLRCVKEGKPSNTLDNPTSEPSVPSKAKKNTKSGKKKASERNEGQQQTSSKTTAAEQKTSSTATAAEESCGDDGTALTAEQQLNRELDWCIEQLELGMRTQKGTPKQKEEASRAVKTLRSSKAPLAKKRQVMRAMTGDYRKKMAEERDKQFKLVQTAMTSAQVKAVSDTSKKSVFHRKAENKTQTQNTEEKSQGELLQTQGQTPNTSVQTQEETTPFILTPSKEEFCFNFL